MSLNPLAVIYEGYAVCPFQEGIVEMKAFYRGHHYHRFVATVEVDLFSPDPHAFFDLLYDHFREDIDRQIRKNSKPFERGNK